MDSGKWQTWTVAKILSDEVYTGDMVQGKHTKIGHKQVFTKPEDWIIVRDTHEPVVSREMYEKVQAVREQTMKKSKAHAEKIPYTENILRGRIFCGYCGKNLHRMRHYQGCYLYHCISNDWIGKGACEGRIYLKETDLFNIILTIIRQKAENIIGKSLLLKRKDDKIAAQKTEVNRKISKLRQETGKNRLVLSSLYRNFVNSILTKAEYLEMDE